MPMLASAQRARHRLSRSWGSYGRTRVAPPNVSPSPIGAWRLSRPCALPHPRSFRSPLVGWKRKRPPHEAQEAKGRARRTCPLHEKERPGNRTESHLANPTSRIGQAKRRSGDALGASAPAGPGECGVTRVAHLCLISLVRSVLGSARCGFIFPG